MFQGFSDAAIDFMWGIRLNNRRDWFLEHKQEYLQFFYEPMSQLNAELYQLMCQAFPEQPWQSRVTRIYRDARRLHGRGPYKDHLWLSLQGSAESSWTDSPVFWFQLGPEEWSYGLGMYCGKASTAAKFRARMDADPRPMEALQRKLERQKEFVLEGPEYAREKPASSPALKAWYQKKYFSLIHQEGNSSVLYSRDLVDRVFQGWKFLEPFYAYLSTIPGDPDPADR
ncbi:MAG: DUF2461 domain-containing protein [Oscillospiraceae bacterium]|nr:DUF2461 domain-containing protein [Oscillospiraceae bacterium]